jgi:hypothetical protein
VVHHDQSQDYEVAKAKAAGRAIDILNSMIEKGQDQAEAVLAQIDQPITDHLPSGAELEFIPADDGRGVHVNILDEVVEATMEKPHDNALRQIAQRADIPYAFVDKLRSSEHAAWGPELLAEVLNKHYHENPVLREKNFLTRSQDGVMKGFLSDQYRRLDAIRLVEAFLEGLKDSGARIYAGYALDTKIALKAILPTIYEPIPGEPVGFGLDLATSDFGQGALSLRFFTWRAWCTNLAILNDELRQVHIGRQLDPNVAFSQETIESDTKTVTLALRDATKVILDKDRIQEIVNIIREANNEPVSIGPAIKAMRSVLRKHEAQQVLDTYNTGGIEQLPAGNTKWRFSNAISLVANNTENRDRARELMRLAGQVIQKPAAGDVQLAA